MKNPFISQKLAKFCNLTNFEPTLKSGNYFISRPFVKVVYYDDRNVRHDNGIRYFEYYSLSSFKRLSFVSGHLNTILTDCEHYTEILQIY